MSKKNTSGSAESQNEQVALAALIERQNQQLQNLEKILSPENQEQQQRRFVRTLIKGMSIFAIAISGAIGSWELGVFLKESWDIRKLAHDYANVGVRLYYEENNPVVAKKFLEKAIELQPDNSDFMYLDAYIDGMASVRGLFNLDRPYNAEELNNAYEALAKSVLLEQQQPTSPEPYILRGQIYAALKDNDRAQRTLERAVTLDPKNDFAHMRLGVVAYNKGDTPSALSYLDKAGALNPQSKWVYLWKGVIASEQNETAKATGLFSQALDIDPRFDLAYYNLGWTYLGADTKNYSKAETAFRKALSLNPEYKEAFYGLGMVYGYQRQYEIASEYLSKALLLDDQFLTAFKWRGIVYDELAEYEKALDDFSSAIAIDPANAQIFIRRARVNIKIKNYEDGLSDLLLARKFEPENPRIGLYLGNLYFDIEEYALSLDAVNEALTLRPSYSDALRLRAKIHTKAENYEPALADLETALKSTEYRQERMFFQKGQILALMNRNKEALKNFETARSINPNFADAWLEEAKVKLLLAKLSDARLAFSEYLKLRPNEPNIKKLKNQFGY